MNGGHCGWMEEYCDAWEEWCDNVPCDSVMGVKEGEQTKPPCELVEGEEPQPGGT